MTEQERQLPPPPARASLFEDETTNSADYVGRQGP